MQIYAHRAGRGLAPENTLLACQTSLQYEIDFIDFDIGMTKDGELVVTHDLELNPDITRDLSGGFISTTIPISSLNYSQLATYNVGQINPLSKYASYFPQQLRGDASIPRLRDAIEYVQARNQDIGFQIEMKTDPRRVQLTNTPDVFATALIDLLCDLRVLETTEVQAFDYRCLLSLHQKKSHIKTTFLTHPAGEQNACTLWTAGYDFRDFDHSVLKMIKRLGGTSWSPFQMDVTQELIEEAKTVGLKVIPWGYPEKEGTEFNTTQIVRLMRWGIDGVITDRPDLACKLCQL